MSTNSVLKLAAWGIIVAVVLQVIFYLVFQVTGRDSFLLGLTMTASVIVCFLFLIVWNRMKTAAE